jgi:hypothetical protein
LIASFGFLGWSGLVDGFGLFPALLSGLARAALLSADGAQQFLKLRSINPAFTAFGDMMLVCAL